MSHWLVPLACVAPGCSPWGSHRREFSSQGEKTKLYYTPNQRKAGTFYLEYYPKAATGVKDTIETAEEHKNPESQFKGWQPFNKKDQEQLEDVPRPPTGVMECCFFKIVNH